MIVPDANHFDMLNELANRDLSISDFGRDDMPLQEMERIAKDRSILEITTEASITAKPFFKKMGYTICKEQRKIVNSIQFKKFFEYPRY